MGKAAKKKTKLTGDPHPEDFRRLGSVIMGRSTLGAAEEFETRYLSFFGVDPVVCALTWNKLHIDPDTYEEDVGAEPVHLLWGLLFLKLYTTMEAICKLVGEDGNAIDPQTFKKWAHLFVEKISYLAPEVILWSNRLKGDKGNDCLVSVDGTDCKATKQGASLKAFYSFKFKSSGLRYEICICILTGEIVWINGPFPCGDWNDLTVFRQALKSYLDDFERVEADDGYIGEDPTTVKAPGSGIHDPKMKPIRQRVRTRQETVNKRIKQFKILRETFHHDIRFHGTCFFACVVLTQLAITTGHPLFAVGEYSDVVEEENKKEVDDQSFNSADMDGDHS